MGDTSGSADGQSDWARDSATFINSVMTAIASDPEASTAVEALLPEGATGLDIGTPEIEVVTPADGSDSDDSNSGNSNNSPGPGSVAASTEAAASSPVLLILLLLFLAAAGGGGTHYYYNIFLPRASNSKQNLRISREINEVELGAVIPSDEFDGERGDETLHLDGPDMMEEGARGSKFNSSERETKSGVGRKKKAKSPTTKKLIHGKLRGSSTCMDTADRDIEADFDKPTEPGVEKKRMSAAEKKARNDDEADEGEQGDGKSKTKHKKRKMKA